ncbi:MAG TPA: S9 family peptidase [Rhodothermales bacterium]|nr:S9 family peptidase [Rhodothermales bacterium]
MLFCALLWVNAGLSASAQQAAPARLTLEDLFASPTFYGASFQGGRWADEGAVVTYIEQNDQGVTDLVSYDLRTNERKVLVPGDKLRAPDVNRLIRIEDYTYSRDGKQVLLYTDSERVWRRNTKGYYYIYDIETGTLTPLSDRSKGFQMFAKISPDGKYAAFVRDRDLFLVDLSTMHETPLTSSGSEGGIINGTTDWVYEEEFFLSDAWDWSPDSRYIAFVQLDESAEHPFYMADLRGQYPELSSFRYPKAGTPNAEVHLGVIDVGTKQTRFFDTGTWNAGGDSLEYIPRFGWTPILNGTYYVWMFRENRDQNDLQLLYGDAATGQVKTVLTERSKAGIEMDDPFGDLDTPLLTFLDDGEHFVWLSDRDGYRHLYLYDIDGTFVRQVTSGSWDITDFNGVDEGSGMVYFTATKASPLERQLYRVPLGISGSAEKDASPDPERITDTPGWHSIDFSQDMSYYLDTYSNSTTPPVTTLHQEDGTQIKVLEDNARLKSVLARYDLPEPRFIKVPGADGTPLNAYIITPTDFDSTRQYPMLMHVYGGPGSQEVTDVWGGVERLWHDYLAQQYGIIIVGVDNRGTGARGRDFRTIPYKNLGVPEAQDYIAAAQFLGKKPYIDENRMGIWGWSYGGYMTLMSMLYGQGPQTFHVGMSVAPVTDWRLYDTIYTERYMSTPQRNPQGYRTSSPITYANRLADDQHLLIVAGDLDDNVHFQNTIQMVDALVQANEQFDMRVYPGKNHGIYGGLTRLNLYSYLTDYAVRNLVQDRAPEIVHGRDGIPRQESVGR